MSQFQYHHRYGVPPAFALVLVVTITVVSASMILAGTVLWGVVFGLILALTAIDFTGMSTDIERGELRVAFRLGWPRRVIAIKSIDEHQIRRVSWWHGWGLRVVPGGMLYRVWGREAVEVRYQFTRRARMLQIGTDDASGLSEAIESARHERH